MKPVADAWDDHAIFGGCWETLRDDRSALFGGKYVAGQQDDASEFLIDFLQCLQASDKTATEFGIITTQEFECSQCGHRRAAKGSPSPTSSTQKAWVLPLHLDSSGTANTIQARVDAMHEHWSAIDDPLECKACKATCMHRSRPRVVDIDRYVIFLVCRFDFDRNAELRGLKACAKVEAEDTIAVQTEKGERKLAVRAIVEHQGASLTARGNHYVTHVKQEHWWECANGQLVTQESTAHAKEAQVYLALYERLP